MKKILLAVFILISLISKGQIYTPEAGRSITFLKLDSSLAPPLRDTGGAFIAGREVKRPGLLRVRPADSLLYIYTGVKWKKVAVDSAGLVALINNKVDSVKTLGDTLFYYVNGVAHGETFSVSSAYPTAVNFDTTSGTLTISRNGLSDITTSIDQRYSLLGHTHLGLNPLGGSTGQILKKISGTDYDYSWQAEGAGYVGVGRTLTINGVTYDLSADRTWTIGVPAFPNTTHKYLNGYGAFPTLNTDSITEGSTNKFYTDARARAAISLTTTGTSGAATYNNSTGVLNVPQYAGTTYSAGWGLTLTGATFKVDSSVVATQFKVNQKLDSTRKRGDSVFDYHNGVEVFSHLSGMQPSISFGITAANANPGFVVIATTLPNITTSYTYGVPIGWAQNSTITDHSTSFFDTIHPSTITANRLTIGFPPVKNVIGVWMGNDETTSSHMTVEGATISNTTADFACFQPVLSGGYTLRGDGSGGWTVTSSETDISVSAFNTGDGSTLFKPTPADGIIAGNYQSIPIMYDGDRGYTIKRMRCCTGSYTNGFNIITPSGGYLDTNPTTDDQIIIGPTHIIYLPVNLGYYDAYNQWLITGTSTNFLVHGYFEAWIVADAVSTTSIRVRYQPLYPSATDYKIYRGTDKWNQTTLVHTGTDGNFIDSGLTLNTVYYYKMVAVVGGVDTYVSYFPCPTNY